jgi:segregation and condensation protein B
MSVLRLDAQLESILFVASGPVTISRLASALAVSQSDVRDQLDHLEHRYNARGIRLQRNGQEVQLTSAPEAGEIVERFLGLETTSRLSQAALEVLAIVSYMQPVTRPQVDDIRGVDSEAALRTLLGKELVAEVGRRESPGRPILYGTTSGFLQAFGLTSLDQLPPLADASPTEQES